LRTIDAVQFIDPLSGKLGIQLIRGDYNVGTLPTFDESNILDCDYTQAGASETINEVKVTFSDRTRLYQPNQVKAQDLASVMALGRVVSVTNTYKWVTTEDLALRLAQRDLRARSTPLSKATLKVNREGFALHEGSPFRLSWARAGVASQVMRVAKIQRPGRDDSELTIECIQDVFSTPQGAPAFTQQPAPQPGIGFDNPSEGGAPEIPTVNAVQGQNATIGGVALVITDPDSRVTMVQFQHQSGRGTMTPLTTATAPYHDQVTLDPQYASTINWVVTYATPDGTLDTITGSVTFDVLQAPPAPDLSYTIDGSGNVVVTASVVSTVASVKFASSATAPPSDATTRAASPVTGPFTFTPAESPLGAGATDYITAFAYDAAGNESKKAILTIGAPTPASSGGSSGPWAQNTATTTGLTYGYFGGEIVVSGALTRIANGTVTLTDNTTNYVQRSIAGVASVNTTGFTLGSIPMAKVVTASGAITSVEDDRMYNSPDFPGTGTRDGAHFLADDGTWQIPSGGAGTLTFDLTGSFGDGVNAPQVGEIRQFRVDVACTIVLADIFADTSGSAVVDVQTSSDGVTFTSIAASAKPTLSAQQEHADGTLTGWTLSIAAGDYVRFVLNSVSTCKQVSVALKFTAPTGPVDLFWQFGDGVSALVSGYFGDIRVDTGCVITVADIYADASGSAVVDVQTSTNGISYSSICGAAKPTLASQQEHADATLSGWTTAIPAGTYVRFLLNSVTTCKIVGVTLK